VGNGPELWTYLPTEFVRLTGSLVQPLGANSSKTWACHASPAANFCAEEVQILTEYNVLSAQDLVQNMACHASASPACHAMLKLLLAGFIAEN